MSDVIEVPRLKKSYIAALEKVFAAEIEGRLHQSHAKVYTELLDIGMVTHERRSFGRDRFGAIEVEGWSLTHAGRLSYCMTC